MSSQHNRPQEPTPLRLVPDEITPDPYPERPTADQGVRQRDHHGPHGDWKFKTAPPASGLVVHRPPAVPGRVITARVGGIADRPFAASRSIRVSIGSAPVTWFAVGLSVFAQTIVTLALVMFDADPMTAAAVSAGMLVCSLLLIAAEQITARSGPMTKYAPHHQPHPESRPSDAVVALVVFGEARRVEAVAPAAPSEEVACRDAAVGGDEPTPLGNTRNLLLSDLFEGVQRW